MVRVSQDSALLQQRDPGNPTHYKHHILFCILPGMCLFTLPATRWSKLDLFLHVPVPYPLPKAQLSSCHRAQETLARQTASAVTKASSNPSGFIHPVPCGAHHGTAQSCLFILHTGLHVFPPVSCHCQATSKPRL